MKFLDLNADEVGEGKHSAFVRALMEEMRRRQESCYQSCCARVTGGDTHNAAALAGRAAEIEDLLNLIKSAQGRNER